MPKTITAPLEFRTALVEFIRNGTEWDMWNSDDPKNALNGRLYSQAEWRERGEPYGNDAPGGSMAMEGDFCQAMNQGWPRDGQWDFMEKFTEFCAGHGYWCEMGYHYTFHFYEA